MQRTQNVRRLTSTEREMPKEQSYKTHRRYVPMYHFIVLPVLILNVFAQLLYFNKYRTPYKAWNVIVAIALAMLAWFARSMAARWERRSCRRAAWASSPARR